MRRLGVVLSMILVFLLFQNYSTVSVPAKTPVTCMTVPGGNYNLDPETLKHGLVKRSGIVWFRAILDLYKLKNERERGKYGPRSEMGRKVEAFKAAKAKGLKTVVSLQSSFLENGLRVPKAKGRDEEAWLDQVNFLVSELKDSVDIYVAGNEPVIETQDVDMVFSAVDGYNPMSRYYIRVATHLDDRLKASGVRSSKRIFMGSFNRLDLPGKRDIDGIQRMIVFAKIDPRIDGIDIHVHVPSMEAAERQLDYVRNTQKFSKQLIVTEFSLMWLFKQHLADPLCFSNGQISRTFCDHLGAEPTGKAILELGGTVTELDFINMTLRAPADQKISQAVFLEFFRSRPYLPVDYIGETYAMFNRYSVGMATYHFDQNDPNDSSTWAWRGAYTYSDTPNRLYALFVPQSVRKNAAVIPANPYMYIPFKRALAEANAANYGRDCPF